jgi:hypothetical protein
MNPCSLFCFAGFLAVLWIQYSKKNQWVSGFLFILAVAVIHYTQQTQTNLFFQTLPWLRGLAVFLGLASVYLVVRYYKKQPLSSAPMLFAWVFCFAFLTQTYQQTCVMNWSYIFQQWLATQSLSSGQKTVLQVIYQIIYIMPLVLILCGYVLLQPWKRLLAIKPHLETSGLLFILVISLFLVIRPMALANYLLSFVLLSLLFIAGVVWFHWVIKPKQ